MIDLASLKELNLLDLKERKKEKQEAQITESGTLELVCKMFT